MRRYGIWSSSWVCVSAAVLALGASNSAEVQARDAARRTVHVTAESLPEAIAELAREAHVSIGTDGPLPPLRAPHLHGEMTIGEALARLLTGSGYVAHEVSETAWRIELIPRPSVAPSPAEPTPPPQAPPDPIIVTATKQPLDLLSLPAAVSVVRLTERLNRASQNASASVASRVEGLAITSLGPGRNRLFLRGVADSAFSGESQSTVAVVLDEARLTYAAPDPDIRLVDMERVEVLKGPQGSLYGTGALGGIYRMVSHPADLANSSFSVTTSGSKVAHGGTGYSLSAVANLPLATGTAALRLVGYTTEEPGWIDTGNRNDSNGTHVSGIRAQAALVPIEGWRLDITGFGQWLESRDSRYVYAPRSYTRDQQLPEPHDNDLTHIAGRLTGELGGVDVMLASAITWHTVNDTLDATVGAESFGLADPQVLTDDRRYRTSDSELRLRGRLAGASWLMGLTHLDARQSIAVALQSQTGAELPVNDDRRDSHDSAAYFNLTVPLAHALSIDGGARLFLSSVRETRLLPEGLVTRKQDKAGVTPSLALAWQPNSRRLIYLRYGSAFRQGGTDITPSGAIDNLRSDELASIEAGWRESLAGGGHVELSAWYSRWDNVQSDVLLDNGLVETTNAGDAVILGIEGHAEVPIAGGWRLEGGANATSARLTRNALGFKLKDTRLPVVPEYTLRTALRRDFKLGAFDAWARLSLRYIGPARMSFDPAIDRGMGDLVESALEMRMKRNRWELGLSVQNLLNDKGNVFAFGNALRYRLTRQFSPQQPPTILFSAAMAM
ncbi:TonB-dependent receptor [Novosphingobium sp.]|nr:TonB-dependent receptor [Novosphingobium sp.]